jgi:5-formyltetrahydrofolate cyclo-ligase
MDKNKLRQLYLDKRRSLSRPAVDQLSEQLTEQFFRHIPLAAVQTLHLFLPIQKNNEPDTWKIIHRLRLEHPSIRIVVPKINGSDTLDHYELDEATLGTNTLGIPEPEAGKRRQAAEIDLVIVPLVIADKSGHRVGYGKGYYDRFLVQCPASCVKVGLSFFPPVSRIPGIEAHDHPLDWLVLPEDVIRYNH